MKSIFVRNILVPSLLDLVMLEGSPVIFANQGKKFLFLFCVIFVCNRGGAKKNI